MQLANHYAALPQHFSAPAVLQPVKAPRLVKLNTALARSLGLDPIWLSGPEGVAFLAGNRFPDGINPVATAYAGHQFGHLVPQLGDGRALLLGDGVDERGKPFEIQMKGAGRTPFSRRGDGRAALGPVLREYLVSEAMAAFGVPTTRALAAVSTGETVVRATLQPGAILTRVASSHIRVGTFQFFALRGDDDAIRQLADFALERHYPELIGRPDRYLAFFDAVVSAQAELIAHWMSLGFIHGVMNTDNMTVSGETIDYGPCAFLDEYDPRKVFSSIDQGGRYAYDNQPRIAQWNLARLAETLLPLMDGDADVAVGKAQEILMAFPTRYGHAYDRHFRAKLGLRAEREEDHALIVDWLTLLAAEKADFTLSFRQLSEGALAHDAMPGFGSWHARWRDRVAREDSMDAAQAAMRFVNPVVIPRNHRIEAVISAAETGDFGPFEAMLAAVTHPFDDDAAHASPPRPEERVWETFCGT
ncbi:hypothetical protein AA101099_2432 [Neoasaia chiangmaiensis NBRC 101099]|uniref:Protein nucleotidyltransferase YdiU n=1 Tax=Neoasaia chiangmaiensis TaxID=320497 RepID=A0A1U9KS33_9PROT|nr:YdiU family protein [Neoasaia chiangmaiensis]AQS88643.1 hypothetical protein A0U93_12730 [Neoasaia chiangmaiensis]GBR41184.1 hypothetical protein AA101099_2432 [Neoasaia chiangmaiensis NBRC 101099]GEN13578.1 UPF0061 protein [Neoasaia chiangmaiensis]